MSIEKKRFFVSSTDDPKPSETVDISQNSLFVSNSDDDEIEVLSRDEQELQNPFISQTALEPPDTASQPPQIVAQPPQNTREQTSAPDPIKLELFSSQLTNAIGEISPRFRRYLFKKYFGKPDYIQLAINEYLDGIDPEEMSNLLQDKLVPDADNKRPLDEDPATQVDNLYHRMLLESSKNRKEIENKLWRRYIGSLPVQAWATRPIMKPLQYLEKLILKRLIPKNSSMSNSSIIRLCTVPQNNEKFGREMARIPEDLTRTLSPLFDLDIALFETTVLETTKKRLSTGDSFLIQIDVFLKNTAFENKGQETTTQDLKAAKKQKLNTTKTGFNFSSESENEAQLRLRQFALSKLFETLSIKPTKSVVDTQLLQTAPDLPAISPDDSVTLTQTQAEPINLDSDSELDEDAPEIKPVDHVNLDQLKEFYQANNQSSLLNSLPETTKPPSSNFGLELRPYQMHGLSWMLTREKEISTLEILASNDDDNGALSTQSKKEIREKEDGVMNPLWRRYKWPQDSSVGGSEKPKTPSQEGKYFYANMYNGEMSLEKPLIKNMLKGGILADEMGLGKTISALALINSVPYDPTPDSTKFKRPYASKTTLIVVPMSLLSQWKLEFDKANNNKNHFCYIYYGDSTESSLTQLLCNNNSTNIPVVVLTTYGTIVNEFNRINKFRGVNGELPETGLYSVSYFRIILDEAHNIRNRNTKSAKSIYELSLDRKWALTGTPIINRLDDLYSLVKFLELDPWCNFSYWKTFVTLPFEEKRISQTLDVIKSILEPIFLRRTKNMKQKNGKPMVELPDKEVVIEQIKFNEREAQIYNWFKAKANRSFKEGINSGQLLKQYTQILTHILRLRQICCHTDLVGTSHEMEEVDENTNDSELLKDELKALTDQKGNSGYKNETEINQAMYPLYLKINIEDSECSICTQAPIALGEMVVTPCGHQFCLNCLLEHIEFQANRGQDCFCPNCRERISKYKLFKLRMKETSKKEIRFHTRADIDDPSEKYKFQLHLYDPDKTSSKIQALIGHLRTLKAQNPGEKVIVFSQFSSYLDIIENEIKIQGGKDFVVYKFDGRLQLAERKKVLDKFNDNNVTDRVTVLLLSLKAGGVGLNLTTASKAFMMDPWWSPSVEDQAIDRIHRIGQNETVKVVRFIMENSIEIKMLKIQERKKQIGEAVGAEEEERRKRRIEEIQILFEE